MVQPQQIQLPTQRDPIARLSLGALFIGALFVAFAAPSVPVDTAQAQVIATPQPIIVIATPTLGLPTAQPAAVLAAPTFEPPTMPPPPPTAEPQVIEVQVPVVVEVTAPPVEAPPEPTAAPLDRVIILPTATQTREEFIASFGPTPDPNAKCAFVGCIGNP